MFKSKLPWSLSFSFARAIQKPALEIWQGQKSHVSAATEALYHRALCNQAARRGQYDAAMELEYEETTHLVTRNSVAQTQGSNHETG